MFQSVFGLVGLLIIACNAVADGTRQANLPGTEEFGLTQKELVQAIDKVEGLIAKCMQKQGFEYVPADFKTGPGMVSHTTLPGMDETEFVEKYGFGVSTMYTGKPPQLNEGYSPGRIGLGKQNIEIFKKLSPADQVAYNRALLGENTDATFAVSLKNENFSRCGGSTLEAIKQVFSEEQRSATYYNPKDAIINKDPRMKAALRTYTKKMRGRVRLQSSGSGPARYRKTIGRDPRRSAGAVRKTIKRAANGTQEAPGVRAKGGEAQRETARRTLRSGRGANRQRNVCSQRAVILSRLKPTSSPKV